MLDPDIEESHRAAVEAGETMYRDPKTDLWVMTALTLIERGYCCESGCRHCPYGFQGWG